MVCTLLTEWSFLDGTVYVDFREHGEVESFLHRRAPKFSVSSGRQYRVEIGENFSKICRVGPLKIRVGSLFPEADSDGP